MGRSWGPPVSQKIASSASGACTQVLRGLVHFPTKTPSLEVPPSFLDQLALSLLLVLHRLSALLTLTTLCTREFQAPFLSLPIPSLKALAPTSEHVALKDMGL